MDIKTLLIVLLVVALGVVGYLYWDSQQSGISVNLPGIKIDAK